MKKLALVLLFCAACGQHNSSTGSSPAPAPTPSQVTTQFNLSANICTFIATESVSGSNVDVYARWDGHNNIKLYANGTTNCGNPVYFNLNVNGPVTSTSGPSTVIGNDTYEQDSTTFSILYLISP